MSDSINITERLLDRVDRMSEDIAHVKEQAVAIVQRLDKMNGSVGRHELAIQNAQTWMMTKDQHCVGQKCAQDEVKRALERLQDETRLSNQTIVKVALIVSATVMAIAKVGGPVLDQVLGMLK